MRRGTARGYCGHFPGPHTLPWLIVACAGLRGGPDGHGAGAAVWCPRHRAALRHGLRRRRRSAHPLVGRRKQCAHAPSHARLISPPTTARQLLGSPELHEPWASPPVPLCAAHGSRRVARLPAPFCGRRQTQHDRVGGFGHAHKAGRARPPGRPRPRSAGHGRAVSQGRPDGKRPWPRVLIRSLTRTRPGAHN